VRAVAHEPVRRAALEVRARLVEALGPRLEPVVCLERLDERLGPAERRVDRGLDGWPASPQPPSMPQSPRIAVESSLSCSAVPFQLPWASARTSARPSSQAIAHSAVCLGWEARRIGGVGDDDEAVCGLLELAQALEGQYRLDRGRLGLP
jgi:hypothetical protein